MLLQNLMVDDRTISSEKLPSDIHQLVKRATINLVDSHIDNQIPKIADKLPTFSLPTQNGETVNLSDILAKGPVVVTFYRGGWCSHCNQALSDFQRQLTKINTANATLVAISPELPESSLSTIEQNGLEFTLLTDVDAQYANSLGLAFPLSGELRLIYLTYDIDIEEHNGADQFKLPLAATLVIAQDGTITSVFAEADYTARQDPTEVVAELRKLKL